MSRREWQRLASQFEHSVRDATATSGHQVAELVDRSRPSRRRTLVDAGCGIGTFVKRFGHRFGRVVAFDFAANMVARARRRCAALSNVEWRTMPLEDAGQALGPIGHLTVCLNVITSTDDGQRAGQWASLAALTRPGGHVLVLVPSVESGRFVKRVAGETAELRDPDVQQGFIFRGDSPQKHYTRDELRQTVARHGLRVVSLRRIHYPWIEEGLDEPTARLPWEWICLARRHPKGTRPAG